jgi:hypothetical protein
MHRATPGIRAETEPNWDFEAWKVKHMDFGLKNIPAWAEAVKSKYGKASLTVPDATLNHV